MRVCVMKRAASLSRFNFYSVTLAFKRRSVTSAANSACRMRLTTTVAWNHRGVLFSAMLADLSVLIPRRLRTSHGPHESRTTRNGHGEE